MSLGLKPEGWEAKEGSSCNGLYFVLCERDGKFRIFWNSSASRVNRWFRSKEISTNAEGKMWMERIRSSLRNESHANDFIERNSHERRTRLKILCEERRERRRERIEAKAMMRLPTFGMF